MAKHERMTKKPPTGKKEQGKRSLNVPRTSGRKGKAGQPLNHGKHTEIILENSFGGALILDCEGKILSAGPATVEMLGYGKAEDLVGTDILDCVAPEYRERVIRDRRVGMSGRGGFLSEYKGVRRDGSEFWMEGFAMVVPFHGQRVHLLVLREITERVKAGEHLREVEQRYRDILENIHEAYFETDLTGNYTFVNDAVCRILGHSREKLLRMNSRENTGPEMLEKAVSVFREVYRTGIPADIDEYEIIGEDGKPRIRRIHVSLRRNSTGDPIGFRGISRDVTRQVQAEQALEESEERYRTILEEIEEGYFELDLAGNIVVVNDVVCRMSGYTQQELRGMSYREYLSPKTAKELVAVFQEVYRTGTPGDIEGYEAFGKDGKPQTRKLHVSLMRDSESKPIGFRGVTRDVTERRRAQQALKESEERYRTILESIQEGYFESDFRGRYTFVNDAMCRILGYGRDELLTMDNRDHSDPETAKRIYSIFKDLYRTGRPVEIDDYEFYRKDGKRGVLEEKAFLICDPEGTPIGFRGVVRDVTERMEAQQALKESEERYRRILEEMDDGYWEVDLTGRFTFFNDAMCRVTGFPKENLMGLRASDDATPDTKRRLGKVFEGVFQTGEPAKIVDYEITQGAGARGVFEMSASLMKDKEGNPIGFRGITRDVTDRKEAERALKESEERYRTILETIEEGYFEVDLTGNYTFVNDAMCRIMGGYAKEEVIGTNNQAYVDSETAKKVFSIFNEVYKTGRPANIKDYEVRRKDGSFGIRELHASLMHDPEGNPIGFRGISRDVTERRRAERALQESEERYRNLFEKTASPIMITDLEGRFIDWNRATLDFLECEPEELIEKNIHDFLPPEAQKDAARKGREYWKQDRTLEIEYVVQGKVKILELSMTPAVLNGRDVVFGVGKDITERKQIEEKLAYMATHDQLTGLPNRMLFNDRLEQEFERSRRNNQMLAVILFDLDRFKEVNDTLGHSMGDLLLKELGCRLKECLRHSDTVARMGGDEFFLLLCDIKSREDADIIAEKILSTIREPFLIESHTLNITASLGIAFYPDDGSDVETLVKKADIAMYRTKGNGRNQYRHYAS